MPKIIKKPSRKILEKLYVDQHLTSIQIAERYKVSKRLVLRWLHSYKIEMRLPGRGLATQGKQQPTRNELIKWIHEDHLSYQEIANMFDTTLQAVSYWLEKYDIPHRSAEMTKIVRWYREKEQPQLPTKEKFLQLYEQKLSVEEIARRYNVTEDMMYDFCQREGIERRLNGWKGGQRFICKDGHSVLSVFEQRVDDWLYEHGIEHIVEPPLPFDRRYRSDFLANGYYIEIWGVRNQPEYIRRKNFKTAKYKEHNLPLIEIYSYHFDSRRNAHWERRLQVLLQ